MSSQNPAIKPLEETAKQIRASRNKCDQGNPFLAAEALWVHSTEQMLDMWRDLRDANNELIFHAVWGSPWARAFGRSHEARRTLKDSEELRALPEVLVTLQKADQGGFVEAVIRMLVLLAGNRGQVRRDRLERSNQLLTQDEPFRSLGSERRAEIIHQQSLIVQFEPDRAIATLPLLLPDMKDRELALRVVQYVPGPLGEMSEGTRSLLQRLRDVLGLGPLLESETTDPLVGLPVPMTEEGSDAPR